MMNKRVLREAYLERRRALTPAECAERSQSACAVLEGLRGFDDAPALLLYLASKDNELDTLPLASRLLAAGRTVLAPRTRPGRVLEWCRIEGLHEVGPGRFGILEPLEGGLRPVTPPPDAWAVVPGLVFSRDGYRVGYGGGYYDRFLAGFRGRKVGLGFAFQLVDRLPVEAHDVPLDLVVTEAGAWDPLRHAGE